VVTAGGAADDFATDEFAYRLPSIRRTFGQSVSGMELVKPGWLLEPEHTALVERMRWLVTHPDEARAKGRAASEYVRREWTWECAAQKAMVRLQALAARAPKISSPPAPRKAKAIELPACARLGHLGAARELFQAGKLVPAWNATATALKTRPYHPEAFLLLAEIAAAAGDGKRSHALTACARKMAPKWKTARKLAKNSPARNAMPRLELPALPPYLDPSSSKRPAPRLSVFVITRNEEKFIGRCLESVRDLASQIVVVDSGSTDWTKTIAERFGAEVHGFEWCDDFSAARNAALEKVTGDWVLMLDADEELLPDQKDKLRALLADDSAIAFRLPMRDKGREAEGEHFVPRLFRNAPGLFYVGRIHEQIFSSVEVRRQEWGLENKFGDAVLLHHGYTQEMVQSRGKIARNLKLLQLAVEELPGEPNLLMNLGLELVRDGQLDAGLEQYAAAFSAMVALPKDQVTPELRESLVTQYASHLIAAKRPTEAVRVLESPLAKSAGLTASMHWLLGLAYIEQKQFAEGAAQMRECLAKRGRQTFTPVDRNILKGGPHHCLALCLAALKHREPADRAFHAALEAEPESRKIRFDYARFLAEGGHEVEALKWLHQLAAEDASEVQVWICGGQLALRRPEFLEFANDWTGESFKLHSAHAVIVEQRATALLLNGDADGALAVWRQADGVPSASRVAALALCEVLAGQPVTTVAPALVPEASREFLQWYRRLLSMNATRLVGVLHERLEQLRPVLPAVAQMIGDAVSEANAVPVK
jgi:predicted Zn-dependent protease